MLDYLRSPASLPLLFVVCFVFVPCYVVHKYDIYLAHWKLDKKGHIRLFIAWAILSGILIFNYGQLSGNCEPTAPLRFQNHSPERPQIPSFGSVQLSHDTDPIPAPDAPLAKPTPAPDAPLPEPRPAPDAPLPNVTPAPDAPLPEPRPAPDAPFPRKKAFSRS